jgi:hypothetical protein
MKGQVKQSLLTKTQLIVIVVTKKGSYLAAFFYACLNKLNKLVNFVSLKLIAKPQDINPRINY